jgi:hypothetical protein
LKCCFVVFPNSEFLVFNSDFKKVLALVWAFAISGESVVLRVFNKGKMNMKKVMVRACLLAILATAVTGTTVQLRAQETNTPAVERDNSRKRPAVLPFHGKLKAIDPAAQTILVHDLTIHVPAQIRIDKSGAAATLADGVVGEMVSGGYRKTSEGKLVATTIHFGPKTSASSSSRKAQDEKAE